MNEKKRTFWMKIHVLIFVSVLPEQPVILDRWGQPLNGSAGPDEEGADLILTCRVTGGKCPHPQLN